MRSCLRSLSLRDVLLVEMYKSLSPEEWHVKLHDDSLLCSEVSLDNLVLKYNTDWQPSSEEGN